MVGSRKAWVKRPAIGRGEWILREKRRIMRRMQHARVTFLVLLLGALACRGSPPREDEAASEEAPPAPAPVLPAAPAEPQAEESATGAAEEAAKWDVEHPPLPTFEATLDTREGTWMSVDVSPDGSEIAFDLLGDLYVLPIEGGEARALSSGLAWDMQPRYSPDGAWIAFTSDRGGGDNVWVMRRDGSEPRAVTKETFRLLNSPVWSPDGEFLAARKHFTSHRSLGAGEIWLYHKSGGTGSR